MIDDDMMIDDDAHFLGIYIATGKLEMSRLLTFTADEVTG